MQIEKFESLYLIFVVFGVVGSKMEHPGLTTLVAAQAKPPNYMYFLPYYESGNLADKLHLEEWTPSINQVLTMSIQIGIYLPILQFYFCFNSDCKS